jgi:hypothetical protein
MQLDSMKGWLAVHNAAVMMVLFLVLGVDLIAQGRPAAHVSLGANGCG